jgi:hypothetical protein
MVAVVEGTLTKLVPVGSSGNVPITSGASDLPPTTASWSNSGAAAWAPGAVVEKPGLRPARARMSMQPIQTRLSSSTMTWHSTLFKVHRFLNLKPLSITTRLMALCTARGTWIWLRRSATAFHQSGWCTMELEHGMQNCRAMVTRHSERPAIMTKAPSVVSETVHHYATVHTVICTNEYERP